MIINKKVTKTDYINKVIKSMQQWSVQINCEIRCYKLRLKNLDNSLFYFYKTGFWSRLCKIIRLYT